MPPRTSALGRLPPALQPDRLAARIADLADRRRIAVVPIHGVIGGAARGGDLVRVLNRARESASVRAVMLDIDSPGGSATPSEALYRAVRRCAAEKPVVAWVRGTGASGAYFAACGATRLLAFPSALIGSIGVISVRPLVVDALRRVGATVLTTKTGPFKDMGAFWREPTETERGKEQRLVDSIFRHFTGAVSERRGLSGDRLAAVTTGEVWLAEEAVGLGLVDRVCEEHDALEEAQRLGRMAHRRTVRMHGRRTPLQRLGVPFAGIGPPGASWLVELEGWLRTPPTMM